MNYKQTKFKFVSNEWVDQAEIILNDLVSRFGEEGFSFQSKSSPSCDIAFTKLLYLDIAISDISL